MGPTIMALAIMWYAVHPIRLWGGSGGALVLIGPLKGLDFAIGAPHKGPIPPPRPGRGSFVPYQAQSNNLWAKTTTRQKKKREK